MRLTTHGPRGETKGSVKIDGIHTTTIREFLQPPGLRFLQLFYSSFSAAANSHLVLFYCRESQQCQPASQTRFGRRTTQQVRAPFSESPPIGRVLTACLPGLGVLFDKLQQGVQENQQVLTIARMRADAEDTYGLKLAEIVPATDRVPGGFQRDDGASTRKVSTLTHKPPMA
jgi:hypothetical protein